MKITLITVTFNSDKTLAYTLYSVLTQTYKNIEHIIVDGGSTDMTLNIIKKYKFRGKKFFIHKNSSIYEAINFGIKKGNGDYFLILNSDDILDNKHSIMEVVKKIKGVAKNTIILGSVRYFETEKFNIITRHYKSEGFKDWMFHFGIMPPHPGALIPKKIAKENLYSTKFIIASDFDFFLSVIKIQKKIYKTINIDITRMRTGGISGKNLYSHLLTSREIFQSLKNHKLYSNILFIYLRFFIKLKQLIIFKNNVKEKFIINKYYKKFVEYDFKILSKIKSLNLKKNFVLSGLNLAFLGSLAAKQITLYKDLIHWPDGIFAEKISSKTVKIPGRELLDRINLKNNIKRVVILGYLHDKTKKYLIKKFNRPIFNYSLAYGDITKIIKSLKYRIKENDLIFITLPTPKQEQLAEYLIKNKKNYKIICIGGSLNISSGIEVPVPYYLSKIEFIWRLRYDTFRRIYRLVYTFFYYLIGKYFFRTFINKTFKII
jgi:glycosyltransferase involved in cell wall biosynthesis